MIILYANARRRRTLTPTWGDQLKLTGLEFGKASPEPPKVSRPTRSNDPFAGRFIERSRSRTDVAKPHGQPSSASRVESLKRAMHAHTVVGVSN